MKSDLTQPAVPRRRISAPLQFEVVVIGGGIAGATLSAELAAQGIRTVLLDAGTPGAHGATRYSGGIVRRYDDDPELMALGDYSLECMHQREVAACFGTSLQRCGVLYAALAHDEMSMRDAIARYDRGRGEMHLIGPRELAKLTPFLAPRADRIVLHERESGMADVRGSVRAMVELLRRHGGMVLEQAHLERVQYECGHAVLSLGELDIQAQVVVLATGGWLAGQVPELGLTVRSIPLLRTVASQPLAMPVIDAGSSSYAVPVHGRLVLTGSRLRHTAATPEALPAPAPAAVQDALRHLGTLTGHIETGPVLDILPGFDAYSADNRPVAGFLADDDPRYVVGALSGIGYKLAPGIAALAAFQIADRLRHRQQQRLPVELLQPFAPTRLFAAPLARDQKEEPHVHT